MNDLLVFVIPASQIGPAIPAIGESRKVKDMKNSLFLLFWQIKKAAQRKGSPCAGDALSTQFVIVRSGI